jgi:hypothetical protein
MMWLKLLIVGVAALATIIVTWAITVLAAYALIMWMVS